MKRHEMWEESYRKFRHLEHVPHEDLRRRFQDLSVNFWEPGRDGRLGCKTLASPNGEFWMVRMAEIMEEYRLRGGVPKWIYDGAELMPLGYEGAHPGWKPIEGRDLPQGLLKFGKAIHLRPAIERGELLIRHAAFYGDDPSLAPAIRDDELNLDLSIWPGDFPDGDPRRQAGANIAARLSAGTDYYVWCVSAVYLPRLFDDFKGDACLVLRDPMVGVRLLERVAEQLPGGPGAWYLGFGAAQYIDPLNSAKLLLEPDPDHPVDAFFAKHFRYAFQQEARFIWVPKEIRPPGTLHDVKLEVGSLATYGELIELPETYEKRMATVTWRPPDRPEQFDDRAGMGIDGLVAGDDVDSLIFEKIMQPTPPKRSAFEATSDELLPYSRDYSSVGRVMFRLNDYGWGFRLDLDRELERRGGTRAEFTHEDGRVVQAEASTYELAVCRAALKAAIADGLWDGVIRRPVATESR
jgi:hypothetical protein